MGAVVLTHSEIANELISTAEYLMGKVEGIIAVSIHGSMDAIEARERISQALHRVDQGEGVLILTDLFGGTPSNLAFSFLNSEKVEVITGVNLPMVLTFCTGRRNTSLRELAKSLQLAGRRSIARAKDLVEGQAGPEKQSRTHS